MNEPQPFATSEAFWKCIADAACLGWIAFDADCCVIAANPTARDTFGYTDDELLGQPLQSILPEFRGSPTAEPAAAGNGSTGLASHATQGMMQGRKKGGTVFSLRWTQRDIQYAGQTIFIGLVEETASQDERQARLEAIMNQAVDAIITIDSQGLIDSINPATVSMFGYPERELLGQNIKLLMPEPYRAEHDGYLANFRETGVRKIIGIGREVSGRRKDGSVFPMHLAVSEIQLGDRQLYTGIVRDITDLKKVERQLAEVNEQLEHRVQLRTRQLREAQAELVRNEKFSTLGKVSGGIAHEIRNPLNAVKTSAYYLLHANNPSPEKVKEHLQRIDRQVMMIDNVVTALSDVAKLPDAQLGALDPAELVNSAIQSMALPENIEVQIDIPDPTPWVLADPGQLTIALLNLIRNARDAMPRGGRMTLHCQPFDGMVELSVIDTGSGIATADLDKVMEPLFTTKARGMGLGLSITRAIVEKNQGTLHVESQPGQGSRFSMRLRAAPATH